MIDEYDIRNTSTVGEVIEWLSKYPKDCKILTTWEGIFMEILQENIYMSKWGSLLIDADANSYKKRFEIKDG